MQSSQSSVRQCVAVRQILATGQLVGLQELANCKHADHFECRRCRRIFDLEPYPRDLGLEVPAGYRLEGHYLVLHGICPHCAD